MPALILKKELILGRFLMDIILQSLTTIKEKVKNFSFKAMQRQT